MVVKFLFIFLIQVLFSCFCIFGSFKKIGTYILIFLLSGLIYLYNGNIKHLSLISEENYLYNLKKAEELRPKLATLKKEEALLLLQLEDDPNNQEALFNLAKIYLLTEEYTKAKVYLQHLFSIRPNPKIRELLDSLARMS
jgi:tetratricopeptide (TPR) repeat protein